MRKIGRGWGSGQRWGGFDPRSCWTLSSPSTAWPISTNFIQQLQALAFACRLQGVQGWVIRCCKWWVLAEWGEGEMYPWSFTVEWDRIKCASNDMLTQTPRESSLWLTRTRVQHFARTTGTAFRKVQTMPSPPTLSLMSTSSCLKKFLFPCLGVYKTKSTTSFT